MSNSNELTLSVMYPSEYLKCADLKGKQVTVQIANVKIDDIPMVGGRKERKTVVFFKGTSKKLIAGKTNGYAMGLLFSSNANAWLGKRITLCPDIDVLKGVEVATIRLAGSPDATPDRAAAYARAWKGDRKQGRLVSRIKQALSRIEFTGAPPVEPEEPMPGQQSEESAASQVEPDIFADEEPAQPATAPPESGEVRAPAEAPAARKATEVPDEIQLAIDMVKGCETSADLEGIGPALVALKKRVGKKYEPVLAAYREQKLKVK